MPFAKHEGGLAPCLPAPHPRLLAPIAALLPQAIAQAFEVLSDDQQRQQYDQARWGSAAGSSYARAGGPARRAARGAGFVEMPPPDLHAELPLDFREAALGAERWVEVQAMDACAACAGVGAAPGTPATPCPMCKGRREILKRQRVGAIETRNHEAGKRVEGVAFVGSAVGCSWQRRGWRTAQAGWRWIHPTLRHPKLPTPVLLKSPEPSPPGLLVRRARAVHGLLPGVRGPRVQRRAPLRLLLRGGPGAPAAAGGCPRAGGR